mmetsp:Transcript_6180/g.15797  ORF Transcript_6180/g.15797 Transcript_6180/m.15797 type:complete len:207 (+) Transcript_6180:597-1217(+)
MASTTAPCPRASAASSTCGGASTGCSTTTSGRQTARMSWATRRGSTASSWTTPASEGQACTASGGRTMLTTCSASPSSRGPRSRRPSASPPSRPLARTSCLSQTTGRPASSPLSWRPTTAASACLAPQGPSLSSTTWATTASTRTPPLGSPPSSPGMTLAYPMTLTMTALSGPSRWMRGRARGATRVTRARRSSSSAGASKWLTGW